MEQILSPCESCATICDESLFNTQAVKDLLMERIRSMNTYEIRVIEPYSGKRVTVLSRDIWEYVEAHTGIKEDELTVKHLMVYIFYKLKCIGQGLLLNQLGLVHMGSVYCFNDNTRLEQVGIRKHSTVQLMYRTNMPGIRIPLEAALSRPKDSVTYFDSILKKFKSVKEMKRKSERMCNAKQGFTNGAGTTLLF